MPYEALSPDARNEDKAKVKLPAHRAGLPGKEISFLIVPLDPAYKAGLAGHLPVSAPLRDVYSETAEYTQQDSHRILQ
jgi:hypothetical protein